MSPVMETTQMGYVLRAKMHDHVSLEELEEVERFLALSHAYSVGITSPPLDDVQNVLGLHRCRALVHSLQ